MWYENIFWDTGRSQNASSNSTTACLIEDLALPQGAATSTNNLGKKILLLLKTPKTKKK